MIPMIDFSWLAITLDVHIAIFFHNRTQVLECKIQNRRSFYKLSYLHNVFCFKQDGERHGFQDVLIQFYRNWTYEFLEIQNAKSWMEIFWYRSQTKCSAHPMVRILVKLVAMVIRVVHSFVSNLMVATNFMVLSAGAQPNATHDNHQQFLLALLTSLIGSITISQPKWIKKTYFRINYFNNSFINL